MTVVIVNGLDASILLIIHVHVSIPTKHNVQDRLPTKITVHLYKNNKQKLISYNILFKRQIHLRVQMASNTEADQLVSTFTLNRRQSSCKYSAVFLMRS